MLWQKWSPQCGSFWIVVCPSISTCFMVEPALDSWMERLTLAPTNHRRAATVWCFFNNMWNDVGLRKASFVTFTSIFLLDYDAPLTESGDYTVKYHLLRNLLSTYNSTFLNVIPSIFLYMSFSSHNGLKWHLLRWTSRFILPLSIPEELLLDPPSVQSRRAFEPVVVTHYISLWQSLQCVETVSTLFCVIYNQSYKVNKM